MNRDNNDNNNDNNDNNDTNDTNDTKGSSSSSNVIDSTKTTTVGSRKGILELINDYDQDDDNSISINDDDYTNIDN